MISILHDFTFVSVHAFAVFFKCRGVLFVMLKAGRMDGRHRKVRGGADTTDVTTWVRNSEPLGVFRIDPTHTSRQQHWCTTATAQHWAQTLELKPFSFWMHLWFVASRLKMQEGHTLSRVFFALCFSGQGTDPGWRKNQRGIDDDVLVLGRWHYQASTSQ